MLSCCYQKCWGTYQNNGYRCGAIVSSQSRYHGLQDGAWWCLWLCETADGEGTGCSMDGQTDGWMAWQTPCYCYPAPFPPAAAGAFVCCSQAGGGLPQKNSLVKAFRCFMNKLDSTYSIINLLYSDGLRGRLSCAWTNQYPQIHTNTGF